MRHDSVSPIYIPVTGPSGWQSTATGVAVSINDGAAWLTAGITIVTATATAITLANGTAGTRCYISIPAATVGISALAGQLLEFLVRLTNGADVPVMSAAGKFWIE
jgi:hypothetical protein